MTLTTKLELGVNVWFVYQSVVIKGCIYNIVASINRNSFKVEYTVSTDIGAHFTFNETEFGKRFFLTKEELIKSL